MNDRWLAAGLHTEFGDGVAVLTLDRQARLNAVDSGLARSIREAVVEIEADPTVRVGVITGAGERAFCVGADLKAGNEGDSQFDEVGGWGGFVALSRRKPVIAAVNGLAVGGGLEIALACDFIYASTTARFGFPEVSIGVVAGAGGMFRFPRVVGMSAAKEHMLTGKLFDAATAERIGLVNKVVQPFQLMDEVRQVAATIAENAPISVELTRWVIEQSWGQGDPESWRVSDEASDQVLGSPDAIEGTRAFVEKRKPQWTGRTSTSRTGGSG
jgi:crotonobetainyl-CoA hydratase